ncbi:MAG: GNAT family N-acetyltransferase [Actinomycetota bacterium]
MDPHDLEPLLRYWRAQDELFDRVEPAWWGAVVSDPRYPSVQEPNYARVETEQPVKLAEVEQALLPAMARCACRRAHVVVFRPEQQTDLLVEAGTRGDPILWDLVMERSGATESDRGPRVEEVEVFDGAFWRAHRESLAWFDVKDAGVVDEIAAIERDLFVPAGRRWFTVRQGGTSVAFAALLVLEGVGYIDHVVTFPEARRRGYARALARHAASESATAGAERTYLLADRDGVATTLYRSIGFRPVTTIASWISGHIDASR